MANRLLLFMRTELARLGGCDPTRIAASDLYIEERQLCVIDRDGNAVARMGARNKAGSGAFTERNLVAMGLQELSRMNIHKNDRLTLARRMEPGKRPPKKQVPAECGSGSVRISLLPRANGWGVSVQRRGRLLSILASRVSLRAIDNAKALAILELRRRRLIQARIAAPFGVSKSTVGPVLARAGLSRLCDLEPSKPVVRYLGKYIAHDLIPHPVLTNFPTRAPTVIDIFRAAESNLDRVVDTKSCSVHPT